MLVLLPPSETKRDGGEGAPLALGGLGFPGLARVRREVLSGLAALSRNRSRSIEALKLGPKQAAEVDRNRAVRSSPTMPALERYTGVLYDALDASTLSDAEYALAHRTVAVHSALFGLVRARDLIPAYRLSFDSRLSTERGAPSLKKRWSAAVSTELVAHPGLILDLRSEGYVALGPAPAGAGAHYLRVLARRDDGEVRALNHFNKQAKGLFARALIASGEDFADADALLEWARGEGYEVSRVPDSTDLALVVPAISGQPGALTAVLR